MTRPASPRPAPPWWRAAGCAARCRPPRRDWRRCRRSTAPADQRAWNRVMIDVPTRRCSSTAWLFIDTSVSPSSAPSTTSVTKAIPAVGANASQGSASDSAADVRTVIVRLPRRSTSQPLNELAISPPTPLPSRVSPRAASEMPRLSCSSGSRGDHDANVAPLTKNIVPMPAAATRPRGHPVGHDMLAAGSPPQPLDVAAALLLVEAALPGGLARPRRPPRRGGRRDGRRDQLGEPLPGGLAVAQLRAALRGRDGEHAVDEGAGRAAGGRGDVGCR